jgi:hypothetical protein
MRPSIVVLLWAVIAVCTVTCWTPGDAVPLLVEIKVNSSHVIKKALPNRYNPRFAVDHTIKMPTVDYDSEFSWVKMRLELGRGLRRRTSWITVKEERGQFSRYLEKIQLKFKYRYNVFGQFEKFSYVEVYSKTPQPHITLEYTWFEERMYNPHGAITLFSAISLLLSVVLMVRMTTSALTSQSRRALLVHDKAE